jgi:hypothetical protein
MHARYCMWERKRDAGDMAVLYVGKIERSVRDKGMQKKRRHRRKEGREMEENSRDVRDADESGRGTVEESGRYGDLRERERGPGKVKEYRI